MDATEQQVRETVAQMGIDVQLIDCDPDFADTAQFCQRYGYKPEESANTIVVASKKEPRKFVACVVLASSRLDVNGAVKRRMAAGKVSFASAEDTAQLTGMAIGGVTVFGLPADLPIWIDSRVMDQDQVIVGGGSRSLKLAVAPEHLAALPNAEVVADLAIELPAEPPA